MSYPLRSLNLDKLKQIGLTLYKEEINIALHNDNSLKPGREGTLMYIPNDVTQNYTYCRLKLVIETCGHWT